MKDSVLDILIHLFENFLDAEDDSIPERDALKTELEQEGTLAFTGLWRLLEPIAGAEIKSGEVKELERLKAVVEEREPA